MTKLANRVARLGWVLVAVLVAAAWGSSGASAQSLNTLVKFTGISGAAPGSAPEDRGGLVADAHGNLFGTTAGGGASNLGTVFEIKFNSATGTYASTPTTLVTFNGTNGANPYAGLLMDASGNLFGTTGQGGANGCAYIGSATCGTVFELKVDSTTATGYATTPTILVSFNGTDGALPYGNLIADANGNLFGTTVIGGATPFPDFGSVFELKVDSTTATGYAATATTLVAFDRITNATDGQYPFGGLLMDASGNLFGTTNFGGANECYSPLGLPACGMVFELKVDSTTATGYASSPTILVSFNGSDGAYSSSNLIADAHGNLFGTTQAGGAFVAASTCNDGCGTVFELKTDSTTATGYAATPTTLVSFNSTDGQGPVAGLIADATGSLFGVTSGYCLLSAVNQPSCPPEYGTVFEIKTDSTTATGYASSPTTLITFAGTDGAAPVSTLIADVHGNLFGADDGGTVFEVTGSGFVPPSGFAGTPGTPNCHGVSISTLARTYGGIAHAAMSLGYPSVMALQDAVKAYCGG